jgi:glycosyltransferase involved in cell wall biosynthesis
MSPASGLPWDRVRLSVVVPVYNEVHTVEALLKRVREVPLNIEIVAVDDGSTDGTTEILSRLEKEGVVDDLLLHVRNRGKGAALQSGFARATGDVVVVQDSDLEYDPMEFPALLTPILQGWADAVYGSRFLGGPRRVHLFSHRLGNVIVTFLSNLLTDLDLSDMETCYKVIRRDLLITLPLTRDRFGIEPELTARLSQAEARIYEVPISYRGRSYDEGKNIGWRDGIAAIWHILRCNLLPPRAPKWNRPAMDPWSR